MFTIKCHGAELGMKERRSDVLEVLSVLTMSVVILNVVLSVYAFIRRLIDSSRGL